MKFIGWTSGKYMGGNTEKEKRKKKCLGTDSSINWKTCPWSVVGPRFWRLHWQEGAVLGFLVGSCWMRSTELVWVKSEISGSCFWRTVVIGIRLYWDDLKMPCISEILRNLYFRNQVFWKWVKFSHAASCSEQMTSLSAVFLSEL